MDDAPEPNWDDENQHIENARLFESEYGLPMGSLEYDFPKKFSRKRAIETTRLFAYARLGLDIPKRIMARSENKEFTELNEKLCNPMLFKLAEEYPLPISYQAITYVVANRGWFYSSSKGSMPRPLVENCGDYAGLAIKFHEKDTVGWFIGLVENVNQKRMDELLNSSKPDPERFTYLFSTIQYRFIEGMMLLEGKFDECESVLSQLKNFKIDYDKYILGKVITGRRFSYDSAFFVSKAKEVLKKEPKLKQEILVTRINRSLRAFQMDVRNEGYKDFRHLKAEALKK